jgi:peptide/nickel transport system permease protein
MLFWLVLTLTFALVRLAPGDTASLLIPPGASAQEVERLRASLGLDEPVLVQYARWLGNALRGDLGESSSMRLPVTRVLADALPVSVALGVASLALSYLIGVAIGMVQAARRGRVTDILLTTATTAAYAAPTFWLSLALVAVFTSGAARWGFPEALRLPAFGLRDPAGGAEGLAALRDLVRHSILPVAVLAAVGAAGVARYARSSVADIMDSDFVRTARAKGAGVGVVYGRHLLRPVLPSLIVLFALALPGIVAGSVFVESVFAWPGMGRTMIGAIAARDYPLVMGATVVYAAIVISANLAADILLPVLDPRRR